MTFLNRVITIDSPWLLWRVLKQLILQNKLMILSTGEYLPAFTFGCYYRLSFSYWQIIGSFAFGPLTLQFQFHFTVRCDSSHPYSNVIVSTVSVYVTYFLLIRSEDKFIKYKASEIGVQWLRLLTLISVDVV